MRNIVSNSVRWVLVALITAAVIPTPTRAGDLTNKLNGGYFLLHKLAGDEAQVPLLLDVKHAPPKISPFADEVSKTAKETQAALERFQDHDSAIKFDKNPLPQMEQDVRESIKGDKQHQLLFGTSDSEFARAFIVSQIEATTYGGHITKVLAEQEPSEARAKVLRHLSAEWLARRDEAFRILRDY